MKSAILASVAALALPATAIAADAKPPPEGWSGSGEAGLAVASGNSRSQNLNAKLDIKFNDERWKDEFYLIAQRNKSSVTSTTIDTSTDPPTLVSSSNYKLSANRYEAGASGGYKLDDHSYVVGALRYEHDEFSPYDYQYIASIGYGYQVLDNARDKLALEIGAGDKVVQPTAYDVVNPAPPPDQLRVHPDSQSNAAARGKFEYRHTFNAVTSFVDTLLVEASGSNTFTQNDAGLQVKMNGNLALKVGYQLRRNSEVQAGFKQTDQLLTTNLVYGF